MVTANVARSTSSPLSVTVYCICCVSVGLSFRSLCEIFMFPRELLICPLLFFTQQTNKQQLDEKATYTHRPSLQFSTPPQSEETFNWPRYKRRRISLSPLTLFLCSYDPGLIWALSHQHGGRAGGDNNRLPPLVVSVHRLFTVCGPSFLRAPRFG